jgi:hypothetical protein
MTPQRIAFIRHYVELFERFANVVFEIGNENDLQPGWTPEFERANYALIRSSEKLVVHVVISNTKDYGGPYEAFASHQRGSVDSPVAGRPVIIDEYNNHMTPAEFAACYNEMKTRGGACMYWRSDGSDADQDASLAVLKSGGVVTDFACPLDPLPNLSKLDWWTDQKSRPGTIDTTPFIRGDHDHCDQVGMGTWPDGSWRWDCPLANEGDPRRIPCEQWAIGGVHPLFHSDGEVSCVDDACFRVRTTGTWLEVCANDGTHCKTVAVE